MEKTRKENKKKRWPIIYISLAIILFLIGFYGFFSVLNEDTIYSGVKVEKIDISNMTKEEALDHIKKEMYNDLNDKKMILKFEDKKYTIGLKELGFYYDYEKAVDESYKVGREGNVFSRLKSISRTKQYGKEVKLKSGYDLKSIDKLVDKISGDIKIESKDAVFYFNQGNISITEEKIGRKVNEELLKEKVKNNIYKLEDIDIPVEKVNPKVTKAELSKINGIIGQYSTSFKASSKEKKENIRISAKALDGKLLMPGAIFSFNETTGPRSEKNGYREATVIVNGEFTPGLGGGVCQVSTTLYNAILLSNLEVIERHPHSLPVKYVAHGKDAAVAYGALDLKFKNNFDFPVYIHTKSTDNNVNIYIYGDKNRKR